MEYTHRPVLLRECLEGLAIRPEGTYLDGTLGRAGHSREIARRLGSEGRLICIDRDQAALDAAGEQHRVDGICLGHGRQELGLPGGGSSAPDIQPGGAHLIAQEHRAAGGGLPVLGMAHTKSPHFHNSDLSHLTSLLGVFLCSVQMDLSCRNSHFDPAPHQSTEGAGTRSV